MKIICLCGEVVNIVVQLQGIIYIIISHCIILYFFTLYYIDYSLFVLFYIILIYNYEIMRLFYQNYLYNFIFSRQ